MVVICRMSRPFGVFGVTFLAFWLCRNKLSLTMVEERVHTRARSAHNTLVYLSSKFQVPRFKCDQPSDVIHAEDDSASSSLFVN